MIETINLETLEITSNNIFVLPDPDYSFVEILGPQGAKVQLKIVDNTNMGDDPKQISITGTVLKAPERLLYHYQLKKHDKGKTIAGDEFESLMRQTMPHDTELNVAAGDKVIFDYKNGLESEAEGRLFKDVKHGYVVMLPYHTLFAKVSGEDLMPLNGWVFFLRDQRDNTEERDSGIVVVSKIDRYESNMGTVVCADAPVRGYIDRGSQDARVDLTAGERILIQRKFGSRIAFDLYAGKFKGVEACKRKNILAIFEDAI